MSRLPSEYFAESIYTTFQDDWVAFRMLDLVNPARLMWANDFPHSDSTWPWSQDVLREHTKDLTEHEQEQVERVGADAAHLALAPRRRRRQSLRPAREVAGDRDLLDGVGDDAVLVESPHRPLEAAHRLLEAAVVGVRQKPPLLVLPVRGDPALGAAAWTPSSRRPRQKGRSTSSRCRPT